MRADDVSLEAETPPGPAPPLEASAFQVSNEGPELAGVLETLNPSTRSWLISLLVSVCFVLAS